MQRPEGARPRAYVTGGTDVSQVLASSATRRLLRIRRGVEKGGQAARLISIGWLKPLRVLHLRPIDPVVFREPSDALRRGRPCLRDGLALRCLQRLSCRDIATRQCPVAGQPEHQRSLIPGPLVLRNTPVKSPAPAVDKDRTVSRRSEPSSRTALIGEQPNPWDLLQPQDAMSRHRGAKPLRRCELLAAISLLSPEYLLSDEQRRFHIQPLDH